MEEEIKQFIDDNILHSTAFDNADERTRHKAINNATSILYSAYKGFAPDRKPLPVEAIALQTLYLLNKDDSDLRADRGATYVGFNGVAMNFNSSDRSISPDVVRMLGRRIGSYAITIDQTNKGFYPR